MNEMTLEELWQLFPIALSDHRAEWADRFARERRRILSFLPNDCPVSLSHIGSTAIPGIKAKNIVDILAETAPARFEKVRDAIAANGYTAMSESAGRVSFNRGYTEHGFAEEVFHLHLRYEGDNEELLFRDYLTAHPQTAREFESLKVSLAEKFRYDRDGYTEAKGGFIRSVTERAKREAGGADKRG